jgi:hypothetical protein
VSFTTNGKILQALSVKKSILSNTKYYSQKSRELLEITEISGFSNPRTTAKMKSESRMIKRVTDLHKFVVFGLPNRNYRRFTGDFFYSGF